MNHCLWKNLPKLGSFSPPTWRTIPISKWLVFHPLHHKQFIRPISGTYILTMVINQKTLSTTKDGFHQPIWLTLLRSKVTVQAQVVMNVSGSKHWVDGEGTVGSSRLLPWWSPRKIGETFSPERLQNVKKIHERGACPKESTYDNGSKVFF